MIFLGDAASPPKNTLDWSTHGRGIDLGHVPFVEFNAAVALIQGKAFSWPTPPARRRKQPSGPVRLRHQVRRPLASYSAFTFWKVTPSACHCRE